MKTVVAMFLYEGTTQIVIDMDQTAGLTCARSVALMRETLDEAWASIQPQQRATMQKTTLAVRILETAAQGERDPQRGQVNAAGRPYAAPVR